MAADRALRYTGMALLELADTVLDMLQRANQAVLGGIQDRLSIIHSHADDPTQGDPDG